MLNFLYGTADKALHTTLNQQIIQDAQKFPQDQFFLIVPNHIKFESEVSLMSALQADTQIAFASNRTQVFSFSRLAWFFLKDTQFYQKNRLDAASQSMILTKILHDQKKQLKIFPGEINQAGFLSALGKQLDELTMQSITPENLAQAAEKLDANTDTAMKLHDLNLILLHYQSETTDKFLDNNQVLNYLNQYLLTQNNSHRHFYLHGFTQLSALEHQLVDTLMTSAGVVMTLILDKPAVQSVTPEDLFFRSKQTQQKLMHYAKVNRIAFHNTLITKTRVCPDLQTLGTYWIHPQTKFTQIDLPILYAKDLSQEVEAVALKIHQLVVDKGYHYSDFLVLTKHLTEYRNILSPVFSQFKIPYFNDLQIPMQDHPLLEFITEVFAVKDHHFRYQDIMRLLRTELILPKTDKGYMATADFRHLLDITDNYLLAHNLYEKDWLQAEAWHYQDKVFSDNTTEVKEDPEKSAAIETIHQLIKNCLAPFYKQLKGAKTAKSAVTYLYEFLKQIGVLDQLVAWQNQTQAQAQTNQVQDKSIQGFNVFTHLLDQYVAILGDESFNAQNFVDLMQAAFTNTSYSQIPSTLDAVNVSEVGMAQMNNRKVTFFIGLNDQNLPEATKPQTILNDEDRTTLIQQNSEFENLPTTDLIMAQENFLAYTAFLNPTEKLYLSYAQTNNEGDTLNVSPYLQRIVDHFKLEPKTLPKIIQNDIKETELVDFVGTKAQLIHWLTPSLRLIQDDNMTLSDPIAYLYQTLTTIPKTIDHSLLPQYQQQTQLAQKVFSSLHYHNQPVILKPEVVQLLFGTNLRASVSQLETFYENPYAYFLTYGLKLKEREVYDLTPASRGSFYHEVMDEFIKQVVADHVDLAHLTSAQLDNYLAKILTAVYKMPQYDILSSTGRMHFIRYQLRKILKASITNNIRQSQKTTFRPYKTEVPFGGKNPLAGLHFQVDPQHEVNIRGKIDRIDLADTPKETLFNILDYKSRDQKLSYQEIYYGTSLQILTYIQSVLNNLSTLAIQNGKFAGAYYYHLHNPSIPLKTLTHGLSEPAIESQVLKAFKLNGLILNDTEVLESSEPDLTGASAILPLRKKKDGTFQKNTSIITPKQLETLLAYNAHMINNAGQAIFSGNLPLRPVRYNSNSTVLQYSPYLSIFQFDAMLPENRYKDLQKAPEKGDKLKFWLNAMTAALQQLDSQGGK